MNTLVSLYICSSEPVAKKSVPPVIVVGLPRSGSSYLAHVLSCLDDWFIFDDLYPYQKAASLGISSSFNLAGNPELLKEYINRLTWQLRAKIKHEKNFHVPDLTWEDTFEMEKATFEALETRDSLFWYDVLEEWITRLALHSGKSHWGYKTPQDYMHMNELTKLFPEVKFIYILRDPRKVLQSFKSLPRVKTSGTQDGVSRQYHPAVYALYWKKAYETVHAFTQKNIAPVEIVKFEDLVKNPEAVAERLAEFLNTTVSGNVAVSQSNSSSNQGAKRELTNTEIKICEQIAGACMVKAGYSLTNPTPKVLDIFDLANTSLTFASYQLERIIKDKQSRASVFAFINRLFKKG